LQLAFGNVVGPRDIQEYGDAAMPSDFHNAAIGVRVGLQARQIYAMCAATVSA